MLRQEKKAMMVMKGGEKKKHNLGGEGPAR